MHQKNVVGVPFRIRKGMSIGEADAESDQKYLSKCFIDTGDYKTLIDLEASQRIIVGRTGSGKSALIRYLSQNMDHVIEVRPEDLSLNYISNSDLIETLTNAGIKLDIFYTLLWRHVFAVELLKSKFDLATEEKTKQWLEKILLNLKRRDQKKERAMKYLREWGDKFWEETEYRVVEVTQKLETDIKAQMGVEYETLRLGGAAQHNNSKEVKWECLQKAQKIVNSIQVKALSDVMDLLAEDFFDDPQEKRYIVIDKLDENWVDSDIRYRLIRALIETIKHFKIIPSVKIVIALRQDLVQSVFDNTRDAGFQEEKFDSLFLHLHWTPHSLTSLLNKRVNQLVTEEYTQQSISVSKLFPNRVNKVEFHKYLFERTLFRPRDVIAFINSCLKKAEGKQGITAKNIKDAEMEYSAKRIDALSYEWINHYPSLEAYFSIIEKMPSKFKLSEIARDKVDSFVWKHSFEGKDSKDPIIRAGYAYLTEQGLHAFVTNLIKALFNVGVLGIKLETYSRALWNYNNDRIPTDGQIKPTSVAYIHPMLWARLGIAEVTESASSAT